MYNLKAKGTEHNVRKETRENWQSGKEKMTAYIH